MRKPFSIKGRLLSIAYAVRGAGLMLATQHSAWIHALATTVTVVVGFYLGIDRSEWCWIVLAIMAVWTAEALNTAVELLADVTSPHYHPLIGKAKDVAAGAVLISAIGAVVIGLLVFGPHLLEKFPNLGKF
jgi:diacylglycerol kinase (ATP)